MTFETPTTSWRTVRGALSRPSRSGYERPGLARSLRRAGGDPDRYSRRPRMWAWPRRRSPVRPRPHRHRLRPLPGPDCRSSEARSPTSQFHVGDFAALDIADSSLGGIVARYSLIHLLPSRLGNVFSEWIRVLEPGAPVLLSFFASSSADAHGSPFDHAVVTAYELFPATIAGELHDVGFSDVEIGALLTRPKEGDRFEQGTVLARDLPRGTVGSGAGLQVAVVDDERG